MRKWELDKCRIFACLMVVMLHVAAMGWFIDPKTYEWRIFNLSDTLVRGSVPLFFMISGALFLAHEELNIRRFFKKNLWHLVFLYIVWATLYEIIGVCLRGEFDWFTFLLAVCKGHYHLWFLPAMMISYLFLPAVHHAIRGSTTNPMYFLLLFGLFTLLVANINLIPELPELLETLMEKLNITDISYLGYMVWGYCLSQKHYGKRTRIVTVLVYVITSLLTAYANRLYSVSQGQADSWLYGYFTLPSFLQATVIFCFFQSLAKSREQDEKHHSLLAELSACTLGVYLLHPMVLDALSRHGLKVTSGNPVYQIPMVFIITVSICFPAVFLLRRIPGLKKIV